MKRFAKDTVQRITGRKDKIAKLKMQYHVDADLPPTDFQFCKVMRLPSSSASKMLQERKQWPCMLHNIWSSKFALEGL